MKPLYDMKHKMTSHPLAPIALAAFAERDAHDASSLAYVFAGGVFTGQRGTGGNKAYQTVAKDVLGCMEEQWLIARDSLGWYRAVKRDQREIAP